MDLSSENIRFIFGLKIRTLRHKKGFSLKELSELTNVSQSYLNEIEKGKKYPKSEKIVELAKALEVDFNELVTLDVNKDLNNLMQIIDSKLLQNFPFQIFGITVKDIIGLTSNSPNKGTAFIDTISNIARNYDMRVEHFFFAALRSYQEMHSNYFDDLEQEANNFIKHHVLKEINSETLKKILVSEYQYSIEETDFNEYPELKGLRSVWIDGTTITLYVNKELSESQKCFVIGREIGYNYLKLKERAITSSWIKVESFEQVLNNFKASYFSGAILINKELLAQDLKVFFKNKKWSPDDFLKLIEKYKATPETFTHRLSEVIPQVFGLNELHFLRFSNVAGTDRYFLTKELNMSKISIPQGIGLNEHYCRRWLSVSILKDLSESKQTNVTVIKTQHSKFIPTGTEYFCITLAFPQDLNTSTNISLTLGFRFNDRLKENIKFSEDKSIQIISINETCERCPLSLSECSDRAYLPTVFQKDQALLEREASLKQLVNKTKKIKK